jgi:hypothetical protein
MRIDRNDRHECHDGYETLGHRLHPGRCGEYDVGPRINGSRVSAGWFETNELERVKGIEPSSSAWKAVALPLSYTRAGDQGRSSEGRRSGPANLDNRSCTQSLIPMVGEVGLEPTKA